MNATVIELPTVESLSDEIRGVVYERQTLRAVGAGREELERNRVRARPPAAGADRRADPTPPPRRRSRVALSPRGAILSPLRGGGSSVGRAPGCGPGGRGFESRPPPSRVPGRRTPAAGGAGLRCTPRAADGTSLSRPVPHSTGSSGDAPPATRRAPENWSVTLKLRPRSSAEERRTSNPRAEVRLLPGPLRPPPGSAAVSGLRQVAALEHVEEQQDNQHNHEQGAKSDVHVHLPSGR